MFVMRESMNNKNNLFIAVSIMDDVTRHQDEFHVGEKEEGNANNAKPVAMKDRR